MNIKNTKIPPSKQKEFYAAADAIRTFQRKPVLGRCMHWATHCHETPIASHLIPKSWLHQIADSTNHIIRFESVLNNISRDGVKMEARRIGISQKPFVTFPGFCQFHDNALFRCLESEDFTAKPEQLLALTYRSTCREACAKHQMTSCHLLQFRNSKVPPSVEKYVFNEIENCQRLLLWKEKLGEMISSTKNDIGAYVIEFAKRPSILVTVTFSFPATFTGRKLDARYEWVTLSIIPSKSAGYAVFTWNKRTPKNSSLLIKSFKTIHLDLQCTALLNLALEVSESFYLAPEWWNSLSEPTQTSLLSRFTRSSISGQPAPPAKSLLPQKPLVDWGIVSSYYT